MSKEVPPKVPYRGLIPYSEEDANFFFGREPEREIITANLMASRLTLLYGASGVGKSSVLRAGVAHHLRRLARENLAKRGVAEFVVVVFREWRDNPVGGLAAEVQASVARTLGEPVERVSTSGNFADIIKTAAERIGGRLLIILDQFEEYFLYHAQEDGAGTFAVEFPRAVNNPDLPVSFLISIREDALAKLDRFEGRIPNLFDNYLRVEHLDRDSAREAIIKPIDQYNRLVAVGGQKVSIEPALVEEVLNQVQTGKVGFGEAGRGVVSDLDEEAQIETPFLQLVMTRLWNEEMSSGSQVLRLKTLENLGGAESIVRTHLDAVIRGLNQSEQEVAAKIFHYLVTPSGTKIAYGPSDLAAQSELDRQEVVGVLQKLSYGDVRILRTVDPPSDHPDKPWYEIFHDVLAPAILEWRTRYNQTQELADAKRRADEQRRRADEHVRVARRLRLLVAALAVVTLLAFGTSIYAFVKQKEASENKKEALDYLDQAHKAEANSKNQTLLAQDQKAEAYKAQQTALAERKRADEQIDVAEAAKDAANVAINAADVEAANATRARQEASQATRQAKQGASETRVAYANLLAAESQSSIEEHPQRSLLLAIEAVKATEPTDARVPGAEEALRQALAQTGGYVLGGHAMPVNGVAISPNSRWVISINLRGARLWDNAGGPGTKVYDLPGIGTHVAFSADNRWLAMDTSLVDKMDTSLANKKVDPALGTEAVYLYNLAAADPASSPLKLGSHQEPITDISISPDSHWLVTAGSRHDVHLWDLRAADPSAKPIVLPGDGNRDTVISISPDSHWLVTSSWDRNANRGKTATTYLWNLKAANPAASPFELKGHSASVSNVAFSPDGRWLVTSSGEYDTHTFRLDKTPRVWDLNASDPSAQPRLLVGHEGPIGAMAISPDSRLLVTGSGGDALARHFDGTARVWDLAGANLSPKHILTGHNAPIFSIAISSDSHWLATFTSNEVIRSAGYVTTHLWSLNDKGKSVVLKDDFPRTINDIHISADNHWLVSSNLDNTAHVWDLTASNPFESPRTLRGHEGNIISVAFSPDNRWIMTGSLDKTARLWSLNAEQPIASPTILQAERDRLVAISADNRWLVTIGGKGSSERSDEVARVWDLKTPDPSFTPRDLRGHKGPLFAVAISPDNHWVVTGSHDQTARLWDLTATDPSADPVILSGHTSVVDEAIFSPDGKWLVTASFDGTARVWDFTSKPPTLKHILSANEKDAGGNIEAIYDLYFSPDSRWLVTSSKIQSPAHLWDLSSANPAAGMIALKEIDELAFSPDSHLLITSDKEMTIRVWDLRNPAASPRVWQGDESRFAFSPNGKSLITFGPFSLINLWNVTENGLAETPSVLKGDQVAISNAVFSRDGSLLVMGNQDGTTSVWDLRFPNSKPRIFTGHPHRVDTVAISSDNRWLVTGGYSNNLTHLWDLTDKDATEHPIALSFSIEGASFTADDVGIHWLVGRIARSNTIGLWSMRRDDLIDLACRTAGRNLIDDKTEWQKYFPGKEFRPTCPTLPARK